MIYLKFFFLFLGISFSLINLILFIAANSKGVPIFNILLQGLGISGFIFMQWVL